jgi:hypothetical protein
MAKIIILYGSLFMFLSYGADENKNELAISYEKLKARKSNNSEFLISSEYRNGEHLIYDCKKRHFACVNDESFEYCQKKRKESFKLRYTHHTCVPLKKFKDQPSCFEKQIEIIGQIPNKNFCINFDRKLVN